MPGHIIAFMVVTFIVGIILFLVFISFFGIWIKCKVNNLPVAFIDLIFMKFKRVPIPLIVDSLIKAQKNSLRVTREELENHYLSKGNIEKVIDTMIKLKARDMDVPFHVVAKTDLAGYDLDTLDPDKFKVIDDNE
jgi:uncharacterized protein YqfA (UPF0365 family)